MKRNPLFAPQSAFQSKKFLGVRYGLEVDVTGRGSWVEQGLYPTKAGAEKDGRAIKRKEGMDYRVKATRDVRNGITDRAKRYRAQRNKPPGPKRCNFCSSRKNVGIDHISGNEADGEPSNLMYLCKSCNGRKAVQQKRHHIGVRTRQYNGKPSFTSYRNSAMVLLGFEPGDVGEATALVAATPPADRVIYGEMMNPFRSEAQRRKFYAMAERGEIPWATVEKWERETKRNPLPPGFMQYVAGKAWEKQFGKKRNPPTFAQYAHGVSIHRRGAKDEGGAIIHATPPATRSRYARQIAEIKRERRGVVPF